MSLAARSLATLCAIALCALTLCACGNTVQVQPIPHNVLENMVVAPYPVYWLGASFDGLPVLEATHDPGDAYALQYGNCLQAGEEGACVPPVRVVTSPDNSFVPGGGTPTRRSRIRGIDALLEQQGRVIVLPTGGVVVDIYASNARAAAAAAATVVPINEVAVPGAPLAPALPNTGFAEMPLSSQVPVPLHPLG